jgi:hypothetical protein
LTGAVAVAATAAGVHAAQQTSHRMQSGKAPLVRADVAPPGLFVAGDRLDGKRSSNPALRGRDARTLVAPALAPLGGEGPVASTSPDGATVAYDTWHWTKDVDWFRSLELQGVRSGDVLGAPAIHLLSLSTGADRRLEPGSSSIAWRADGALAYTRGTSPNYRWNEPYLRDVVVSADAGKHAVTWSESPDLYRVLAWAGPALLVQRNEAGATPELDVFEGPGQARVLARDADLIAVSPDGGSALVAESRASTASPRIRLVRVADGSELAALAFDDIPDPVSGTSLSWVRGPGDWVGTSVVVPSETGLVVLSVGAGSITVSQVIHLDAATRPDGTFYEPRFTDDSLRSVVAWSDVSTPLGKPWTSAQILCDRVSLTCEQADPVAATRQPRPVYTRSGGH